MQRGHLGRNVTNELQDVGEQAPRHGNLGHLEGDIAPVADDLGADLDQLLLEAGQRPVLDRFWCCKRAQEVTRSEADSRFWPV